MGRWRGASKEERDDYGAAIASQAHDPDQEAARARVRRAAEPLSTREMTDEWAKRARLNAES